MEWRGWSDQLKAVVHLECEPVAVGFLGPLPEEAPAPGGKVSVCQALRRASEGEWVTVTAETCGCPGGLVNLGLGQTPAAGKERLVEFLVEKEKVYCSRAALHRGQQAVPPPLGMAPRVCFAPLSAATFQPDLVLFLGRPGALNELIGLVNYWEGGALATDLSGPACRSGITYPLMTGDLGLSLLDFGARRLADFPEDLLLVSVPLHRMILAMQALAAGRKRHMGEGKDTAEKEIDALGPVEKAPA
jgi:uncharacterized protein (DUF169 family)